MAATTGTLIYLLIGVGVVGSVLAAVALYRTIHLDESINSIRAEQQRLASAMQELAGGDSATPSVG